jgi:hypothetical protein
MSSVKVTHSSNVYDRHVNVIRDANAHVMTVKGRKTQDVV